jgi:hypothetical protein
MKSSSKATEPLRGEAAWRAEKAAIAKRNDATRARGAAERSARDVSAAKERQAADRREASNLPEQPRR